MDLLETVCGLLKYADPELDTYGRLIKYKDQIERNVMIGPKARGYINNLVQIKNDNVECRLLKENGICIFRKKKCDYLQTEENKIKRFNQCSDYQEVKGRTTRPLGPTGG
jgi:hypothetical protein